MTLEMEAPPGKGSAPVHRRTRRADTRPETGRGDLRVIGHIPHDLDGIYVYITPDAQDAVHSLRLGQGRVYWSRHPWAGMGQAVRSCSQQGNGRQRFAYVPVAAEDWGDPDADLTRLARSDAEGGSRIERDFGEASIVSPFAYVPKWNAAPDGEGWLLGFVYDGGRGTTTFYVLDAMTLATQARITMPAPVPPEAFGNWIPDAR